MSKRQYREKQVRKILNEFTKKGYNVEKVFGRNANNISKSKANYDKFIERTRQERSYQREREKTKLEMEQYRQRQEQRNTERLQKSLYEMYGDDAGMFYSKKDEYGININTVRKGKGAIQEKVASKNIDMLTEEMEYTDKNGNKKGSGAFFKNTSEEYGVEEKLDELRELMKNDPNAMRNMSILTTYLYEKIIPMKYENQVIDGKEYPPQYSEHAKAPLKFFQETADKLLKKYKTLI